MKIYKAILIQPEDKPKVRVWESEEPINAGISYQDLAMQKYWMKQYMNDKKEWLQSYKEYDIHPEYVERFKGLVIDYIVENCMDISINNLLKQGIELNPVLIEIKDFYYDIHNDTFAILKDKESKENCPTCGSDCKVSGNTTNYFVPIDKVDESEDDIWNELLDKLNVNDEFESFKTLKEKYTLKRK